MAADGLRERAARALPGGVYVAPAWRHGLRAAHTDALVDQVADLAEQSARAVAASAPHGGRPAQELGR